MEHIQIETGIKKDINVRGFIVVTVDGCNLIADDNLVYTDKVMVNLDNPTDYNNFLDYFQMDEEEYKEELATLRNLLKVGESITIPMTHPMNSGESTTTFIRFK